jgi:predicted small integral membrane protein
MVLVRLCKTALVASIAFFFTLVAYGNLADYGSNWQFVQHVLSMDTTFPTSSLHWRAITDPTLQTAGYWLIILIEILVAVILWIGVVRLLANLAGPGFPAVRTVAVVGLVLGFLLYAVGFVAIGGEWFAMWQSEVWNGQQKAFEFLTMISAVLIVLMLPEQASAAS